MRTALLALVLAASTASAADLQPGSYVTEKGWGQLTLSAENASTMRFSLFAMGANGHQCALEGDLVSGKAKLEGLSDDAPCVVTATATSAGVDVKDASNGACSYYCGARASFEGVYERPAAGCGGPEMLATRNAFQKLYDAKNFAEAKVKLQPVLDTCTRWMDWLSVPRVRNDLAVTHYKLGDLASCRAVLEPLAAEAARTDEDLRENYPPSDYELYATVVKATRYNLKLCAAK